MKNINIAFLLICLVFLIGCSEKKNKNEFVKVSLRQEWFPNSNYAGALFAANDFAKKHKLEIEIEPGSDNIDPVKMVISGQNTFGDAGADKILAANERGADLVVIGVLNCNSPTCFIAKYEKKIRTPKDFEGKRIGVLTSTSTEYVYRTLVKVTNLDESKLTEIEIPFDLGTFITDAYDVRPAFIYDEPVSLDLQKIKYDIIEPRKYGVSFLGTVYFTTRDTIMKNPEVVQAFVNSVADGWRAANKYPERAIEYLKIYDSDIDKERELLSLKKAQSYFQGKNNKILWADIEDWNEMLNALKNLQVIRNVDLVRSIDNSFLEKYYSIINKKDM